MKRGTCHCPMSYNIHWVVVGNESLPKKIIADNILPTSDFEARSNPTAQRWMIVVNPYVCLLDMASPLAQVGIVYSYQSL